MQVNSGGKESISSSAHKWIQQSATLLAPDNSRIRGSSLHREQREVSVATLTYVVAFAELRLHPRRAERQRPSGAMKNFRSWIGTSIIVAVAAGFTSVPPGLHSQQIEAAAT